MIHPYVCLFMCLMALASLSLTSGTSYTAREVDTARSEFYTALQEAVEELSSMTAEQMETELADLMESLEGDEEAIAYVQGVLDEIKIESLVSSAIEDDSETDEGGESHHVIKEVENSEDTPADDFDFEIFEDDDDDDDEPIDDRSNARGSIRLEDIDEETMKQALRQSMKKYFAMPTEQREASFSKVIEMLGDDTDTIEELNQLKKEFEEELNADKTQTQATGDVGAADDVDETVEIDDFKQLFQEALNEFSTMSEDEREERFAQIIESLDDPEAIADVQNLMEALKKESLVSKSADDTNKGSYDNNSQRHVSDVVDEVVENETGIANEEEVLDAIRQITEMEEQLVKGLEIVGDDADSIAEIHMGLDEIRKAKKKYEAMLRHSNKKKAAKMVKKLLSNSNWNDVYEQRQTILELAQKSGRLSSEDITMFQNDPGAWAKELHEVWEEQQQMGLKSEL